MGIDSKGRWGTHAVMHSCHACFRKNTTPQGFDISLFVLLLSGIHCSRPVHNVSLLSLSMSTYILYAPHMHGSQSFADIMDRGSCFLRKAVFRYISDL